MAMAVTMVVVLTSMGASLLVRSFNEDLVEQRSATLQQAFYMAEAGLDRASLNLRTPTDPLDDLFTQTLSTGQFQLDPAQSLGPLTWSVVSHGFSGAEERRVEVIYSLTPQSVFQYAVFGGQALNVSGSAQTDSYDSRLGPYNEDPANGPINAAHAGDVGTNAVTTGAVTLGGSYFIDGQVVVGPNVSDPAAIVSGESSSFITGDPMLASAPATFPMPPVSVPVGMSCPNLSLESHDVVTLNANGVYCYHNLTLKGGSLFTSDGPVTVYITGVLNAKGNSATAGSPSDPRNMLFLMSPASSAVVEDADLTGTTKFYGAIYGPNADITIHGNAEIFGAIIANTVNVTGSAIVHYDEALTQLTTISNTYGRRVTSWREL